MIQFDDESTAERTLLTNPDSRDVVVFGAGFSKAVSSSFPDTDELGHLSLAAAGLSRRVEGEKFVDGYDSSASHALAGLCRRGSTAMSVRGLSWQVLMPADHLESVGATP